MSILNDDIIPNICFEDCYGITCTLHQKPWANGLSLALLEFFEQDAIHWNVFIKTLAAQWRYGRSYKSKELEQSAKESMLKIATFCASFTGQRTIDIGPYFTERGQLLIKPCLQIIIAGENEKSSAWPAINIMSKVYIDFREWLDAYAPDTGRGYPMNSINTFRI